MAPELSHWLHEHRMGEFEHVFQQKGYVTLKSLNKLSDKLQGRLEDSLLEAGAADADINELFNDLHEMSATARRDDPDSPAAKRQRFSHAASTLSVSLTSSSSVSLSPQSSSSDSTTSTSSLSIQASSSSSFCTNPSSARGNITPLSSLDRFAFRATSQSHGNVSSSSPSSRQCDASSSANASSSSSSISPSAISPLPPSSQNVKSPSSPSRPSSPPHIPSADPVSPKTEQERADEGIAIRKGERRAAIESVIAHLKRMCPDMSEGLARFFEIRDRTTSVGVFCNACDVWVVTGSQVGRSSLLLLLC